MRGLEVDAERDRAGEDRDRVVIAVTADSGPENLGGEPHRTADRGERARVDRALQQLAAHLDPRAEVAVPDDRVGEREIAAVHRERVVDLARRLGPRGDSAIAGDEPARRADVADADVE